VISRHPGRGIALPRRCSASVSAFRSHAVAWHQGHPPAPELRGGHPKTYTASSTPPASVRLPRIRAGTLRSPHHHRPPRHPSGTGGHTPPARDVPPETLRGDDAGCNASTGGSWTSPSNWTASPQPKNEERMAAQSPGTKPPRQGQSLAVPGLCGGRKFARRDQLSRARLFKYYSRAASVFLPYGICKNRCIPLPLVHGT